MQPTPSHPFAQLSEQEVLAVREAVVKHHGSTDSIWFRSTYLEEPKRADLVPFLEAEHSGTITSETERPPRLGRVEYDVIGAQKTQYSCAVVDLTDAKIVSEKTYDAGSQPYFTPPEFGLFENACIESDPFKDAMSEFSLPEGFKVTIDPWPYGLPDDGEVPPRYMQGLVFGKDATKENDDANHYAYPIPIIPVMDWMTKKVIRVDRLATGGKDDGLEPEKRGDAPKKLFEPGGSADYAPELLDRPMREGLKPLNVVQPEGASFSAHTDGLVEWQKWRFRISFTPREGAILHDICYENRPVFYRLSWSEMTVPYADPRPPFQRKQAFDLGDGGFGRAANNLELGCDCLGAIHYFDAVTTAPDGRPTVSKSVVCLHEQDNGILWKHTNFRTDRAVIVRNRELVVQFIVTLANYEYILAYKLDLAGGIALETRATGVLSVVGIDEGKTSEYGNVVSPGVLAQNHQHIFAVRIDPAIDSYGDEATQIVVEESHPRKIDAATNPFGNFYQVQRAPVKKSTWLDADPQLNRLVKIENTTKTNSISGKNVGYKLVTPMTQLLLADKESTQAKRAEFAQHHFWVTGHRDGEFYAAGEFTNQSVREVGGLGDVVRRGDWFGNEQMDNGVNGEASGRRSSPVVWAVFGLTHNPRVEDWPVMSMEMHQIQLRPADFFTANPALDVPSSRNQSSVLVPCCNGQTINGGKETEVAKQDPLSHLQGGHPDIDPKSVDASTYEKNDGEEKRKSRSFAEILGLRKKT